MPCGCKNACGCEVIGGDNITVSRTDDTFVVSAAAAAVGSVADTNSIDLTLDGAGQLTGDVRIDPASPLAISITAAGLSVDGSFGEDHVVGTNVNYTTDPATEGTVVVDTSGGARTVTLPATADAGALVTIKREGANNVTIISDDGDTIDGAANYVLDQDREAVTLQRFSGRWIVPMTHIPVDQMTTMNASGALDVTTYDGVYVDTAGGQVTVTLSTPGRAGEQVQVKRSGASDVVIATASTELIEGNATLTLETDGEAVTLRNTGAGPLAQWHLVSEYAPGDGASTLNDLSDVDTTGVVDNSVLRYNSGTAEWEDSAYLQVNDAATPWVAGVFDPNTPGDTHPIIAFDVSGSDGQIQIGSGTSDPGTQARLSSSFGNLVLQGSNYVQVTGVLLAGSKLTTAAIYRNTTTLSAATNNLNTVHSLVIIDSSVGTRVANLPATGVESNTGSGNQEMMIKRSGPNDVTVQSADGDTIDGQASIVLQRDNEVVHVQFDQAAGNWKIIGRYVPGPSVLTKSAAYTVDAEADDVVVVDSAAGPVTITMPANHVEGSKVIIKRIGANDVTIDTADTDTIDGAATKVLNVDYESVTLLSYGGNWILV